MNNIDEHDLNHLFELARNKTVAGRNELARIVGDLFFSGERVLSDRERALMLDILRQLVHDVEVDIRQKLAEQFAERMDAPRDLVITLANDEIEVAHPILVRSTLLHDDDLIEIIRHRTMEHQLAIAVRKTVSETVSDALVETGHEDVIQTMLENEGASVSEAAMEYLVEQAQRADRYQNPLLHRRELSPTLARRMYWSVSAALRQHILERFEIEPEDLDDAMESSTRELLNGAAPPPEQCGPKAPKKLAEQVEDKSQLNPRKILRVLRQGEISFFEALFTKLSGLRITLVRRILYEPGGEALTILCRWAGFSSAEFAELLRLTRRARPASNGAGDDDDQRLLDLHLSITPEAAAKIMSNWRRDPGYLRAIHHLQHPAEGRNVP